VTVGFYHAGLPSAHAAAMVASVGRVMPGVEVAQFSPPDTAVVPGVSALRVRPTQPKIARAVIEAYASVSGEWLFLDTDVIVQQDVSDVFRQAFDVAVATREGTFKDAAEEASGLMARMPYNKGVVFSRSCLFWANVLVAIDGLKDGAQHWMGDQQAMCDVIAAGAFAVRTLPNTYNYPPKSLHDDVRDKACVHFKGPRKAWMLGRAA
jgi:lipopolysaccharide biosynthesis glycosyltransferase